MKAMKLKNPPTTHAVIVAQMRQNVFMLFGQNPAGTFTHSVHKTKVGVSRKNKTDIPLERMEISETARAYRRLRRAMARRHRVSRRRKEPLLSHLHLQLLPMLPVLQPHSASKFHRFQRFVKFRKRLLN